MSDSRHPDTGLAPRIGARLEVLVLGSFPGTRSLADGEYYAHPQNRFWRAVGAACRASATSGYETRIEALNAAGIGLWDVLFSCARHGSLDQAIVPGTEIPNDLGTIVEAHPELRAILLNGHSVARLFHRHQVPREWWPDLGVHMQVMPSTSPAHAAMRTDALVRVWSEVLDALLGHRDDPVTRGQPER